MPRGLPFQSGNNLGRGRPKGEFCTFGYLALPPGALKSVIVGCEADYASIRELVNDSATGVSIKRAVRVPNHYRLEIEDAS